jgi:hypothetical protein
LARSRFESNALTVDWGEQAIAAAAPCSEHRGVLPFYLHGTAPGHGGNQNEFTGLELKNHLANFLLSSVSADCWKTHFNPVGQLRQPNPSLDLPGNSHANLSSLAGTFVNILLPQHIK